MVQSFQPTADLAVSFAPGDDDVALAGGIRVARMCAGLEPVVFLMHHAPRRRGDRAAGDPSRGRDLR